MIAISLILISVMVATIHRRVDILYYLGMDIKNLFLIYTE